MTEGRKSRLKSKIRQARARLMEEDPFFAMLLMYMDFTAVPGMKKISTDGRGIFFSADFMEKLREDELDFALCHLMMHIIEGHIWREDDLAGDNYHFACDIYVNCFLEAMGFTKESYPHLGNIHRKIPLSGDDPLSLAPDEIYGRLPYSLYSLNERARSKFLPDTNIMWSSSDIISGETIISSSLNDPFLYISESGSSGLKQVWQTRIASALKMTEYMYHGKGQSEAASLLLRKIAERLKKPQLDWKRLLNSFVQETVSDYSFTHPDRRFSDTPFFLPDFSDCDFILKEILFMVDTSGSVSDEELLSAYSELKGAAEQFNGKLTGKLCFFDTAVTKPASFCSADELLRIVPVGGGGTDFGAALSYVRNNIRPEDTACIVIITDGKGYYPDESLAMGIPVLWLINNEVNTPPWGTVTRITKN